MKKNLNEDVIEKSQKIKFVLPTSRSEDCDIYVGEAEKDDLNEDIDQFDELYGDIDDVYNSYIDYHSSYKKHGIKNTITTKLQKKLTDP